MLIALFPSEKVKQNLILANEKDCLRLASPIIQQFRPVARLPSRNKTLAMAVIDYGKVYIKFSCSVQLCLISLLCSKYLNKVKKGTQVSKRPAGDANAPKY